MIATKAHLASWSFSKALTNNQTELSHNRIKKFNLISRHFLRIKDTMDDLCKSSMRFFSDQHLCYADILPPHQVTLFVPRSYIGCWFATLFFRFVSKHRKSLSQVRARIQVAVLNFVKILNSPDPAISDLALVTITSLFVWFLGNLMETFSEFFFFSFFQLPYQINRKSSNSRVSEGILTDVSWIFLSHSFCTRSLMRPNAAKAFIRGIFFYNAFNFFFPFCFKIKSVLDLIIPIENEVWKVMEMCFEILVQEKRVTQRELFYKLLCDSPDYFSSQLQVNRTIQGHFSEFLLIHLSSVILMVEIIDNFVPKML